MNFDILHKDNIPFKVGDEKTGNNTTASITSNNRKSRRPKKEIIIELMNDLKTKFIKR
jgi:hypothetical protein